jgi:phosphomevalonate kinase
VKHTVLAPGKLIILGEYAVLEGAHALVAAVKRYAEITIEQSEDNQNHLYFENLNISDISFTFDSAGTFCFQESKQPESQERVKFVTEICQVAYQFLKKLDRSLLPFKCKLDTSQFYLDFDESKLGLGSSAALSVALYVALCKYAGYSDLEKNLFSIVLSAYHKAQGNLGSGIDIAASIFGGILDYQIKGNDFSPEYHWEKLDIDRTIQFIPIWSGHSASTREFLRLLNEYRKHSEQYYRETLQRLVVLANNGCTAYREGQNDDFFKIVHDYFEQLQQLSRKSGIPIISDEHNRIAQVVMKAGGVYKPSGAGGGDLGIAFCRSDSTSKKIQQSIFDSEFDIVNLGIDTQGVTL